MSKAGVFLSGKTPEGKYWYAQPRTPGTVGENDGKKLVLDVDLAKLPYGEQHKELLIKIMKFFGVLEQEQE